MRQARHGTECGGVRRNRGWAHFRNGGIVPRMEILIERVRFELIGRCCKCPRLLLFGCARAHVRVPHARRRRRRRNPWPAARPQCARAYLRSAHAGIERAALVELCAVPWWRALAITGSCAPRMPVRVFTTGLTVPLAAAAVKLQCAIIVQQGPCVTCSIGMAYMGHKRSTTGSFLQEYLGLSFPSLQHCSCAGGSGASWAPQLQTCT